MVLKSIQDLRDDDVLARDVVSRDNQFILHQGTEIKKEYIDKFYEFGISDVYVQEREASITDIMLLKLEIEESVKKTIKDILEHHSRYSKKELAGLDKAADNIISDILKEKRMVEMVFDFKERGVFLYAHSVKICAMAILTALKLGLDAQKVCDIGIGCLLHDIGLRYLSFDYNNLDLGTMNRQDKAEYKEHPINGYFALKDETWVSERCKSVILYHHERLDGSGFPLRTKSIPIECRIVNVCEAFDEMICGIFCKRVKVYEAVEYLKNYKNKLFDAQVVDVFLGFTAIYPVGTHVLTNEGEYAVVLSQNQDFQDRPVIRILYDKNGNEVDGEVIKDLVKIHNIFIEKSLDE